MIQFTIRIIPHNATASGVVITRDIKGLRQFWLEYFNTDLPVMALLTEPYDIGDKSVVIQIPTGYQFICHAGKHYGIGTLRNCITALNQNAGKGVIRCTETDEVIYERN